MYVLRENRSNNFDLNEPGEQDAAPLTYWEEKLEVGSG